MPGEKILVIEDSPEFLGVLAEDVLPLHGYEVLTATTGREGLSKLSSESPDLVLLDLELPDMSGMEILRRVEEAASIPRNSDDCRWVREHCSGGVSARGQGLSHQTLHLRTGDRRPGARIHRREAA